MSLTLVHKDLAAVYLVVAMDDILRREEVK